MQIESDTDNEVAEKAIDSLPLWVRQMLADRMERYLKAESEFSENANETEKISAVDKDQIAGVCK